MDNAGPSRAVVAGWMRYYGRFGRPVLYPLLQRLNACLVPSLRLVIPPGYPANSEVIAIQGFHPGMNNRITAHQLPLVASCRASAPSIQREDPRNDSAILAVWIR
jgi:hypothetical protein